MESKALVKSTNGNVACMFFALSPSSIIRMVNICEAVDQFLLRILVIDCVAESEQYVVELSSLPHFWGNLVKPCSFPIFHFSKNRVEFFFGTIYQPLRSGRIWHKVKF